MYYKDFIHISMETRDIWHKVLILLKILEANALSEGEAEQVGHGVGGCGTYYQDKCEALTLLVA